MALTTEQVLLLNNLMYFKDQSPFRAITEYAQSRSESVGAIINSIDVSEIQDDTTYETLTTGAELKQLITAIQADPTLMQVELVSTHVDNSEGGGGGVSALFVDKTSNEAIVVFKGTQGGQEWKDNVTGGAATSTTQQENALEWYQSLDLDQYDTVTVSGHSKGGNKAQYITVMDNSVDRCLSFDGQGFSDEFIDEYGDQILRNQDKITNYVAEDDPVNLLLNHIGETKYYKTTDTSEGLFDNHCADSMLHYNEDGGCYMVEGERSEELEALDKFLNSYLRTLSSEEKEKLMDILGDVAVYALSGENKPDWEMIISVLLAGSNEDEIAKLLAYLIKYEQQYPEFADQIENLLKRYDMEGASNVVEVVSEILNASWFDKVLDYLSGKLDDLPGWIIKIIRELIEEAIGLTLTDDQIRQILGMIVTVSSILETVEITDSGEDKKPKSSGAMGITSYVVNVNVLRQAQELFASVSAQMNEMGDSVKTTAGNLPICMFITRGKTKSQGSNVINLANKCGKFANAMQEIYEVYEKTETNCMVVE